MELKHRRKKLSSAAWTIFRGGAAVSITSLFCAVAALLYKSGAAIHINIFEFVKSLIDMAAASLLISTLGAALAEEHAKKNV